MLRATTASLAGLLVGLACTPEPAAGGPEILLRGEWIDIGVYDRSAEETCAGTFEYLDAYAGVLAAEFGVDAHLGLYRWYSRDRFAADDPCQMPVLGCAGINGMFTTAMPLEHEVVHAAELKSFDFSTSCPSVISEGLAEVYGTSGSTPSASDFDRLEGLLTNPTGQIASRDYDIAGRFVGFLVERYGLDSLLDMCALAGGWPEGQELATAFETTFEATIPEVLTEFEAQPNCSYEQYRSHVYACGAASPLPGVVVGAEVEVTYELDCASEMTLGPRDGVLWIVDRLEFEQADYLISLVDEDGKLAPVELALTKCGPCSELPWAQVFPADVIIQSFDAGPHELQLRAPEGYAGTLTLTVFRLD